ncbi:MAG: DoxX family protein [Psychrobium sp.]
MKYFDKTSPEFGAFVLRISLGVMWIAHAGLKMFTFTMPGFAGWLESIGFSPLLAWPIFLVELIGGVLILLGVYARHASLALIPVMAVAMYTHIGNGWVHISEGGGWEYPLFLIMASIAHITIGNGNYTLSKANN